MVLPLLNLRGIETSSLMQSAGRHALAQGFLVPIIVIMAARILPVYSGWMVRHPSLLSGLLWTLFVGAALRSGGEMLGGYAGVWAMAVGTGALMSTGAFTVFAVGLWHASSQPREPA